MLKRLKKKAGYALVYVLVIFVVATLLAMVVFSSAVISARSTAVEHNTQQGYFTARSAVNSVVDYIIKNASDATAMSKLIGNTGSGSINNMGTYTVTVTQQAAGRLKVSATAVYNGETSTASATVVQSVAPSGIIPTDNVIYVNGSATSGLGQCTLNGSVYVNGAMSLSQGSAINGFVVVKGATSITGAGNTTKGLYSDGNVTLDNSGTVNGDLFTKGDLIMGGSATINQNATVDGSLNMPNGFIIKDALIGKNAYFAGGAKISGVLKYGGTATCGWGTISTFVPAGATKITNYTPIDAAPYSSQALPIISAPTSTQNPQLYNTAVITNKTISDSGTINSSVVTQLNALPWGSTLTIDASAKDINLLLNNQSFNIGSGLNIEVIGTHNVFIYLKGTSSITISANEYFGMNPRGTNPRLYIIGDGTQSVALQNNSELDACVYIPNGTLSASGSPLTVYKFVGSCLVKTVDISSNVSFQYSKPVIDGTPLSVFSSGGSSGGGGSGWYIESWDDK